MKNTSQIIAALILALVTGCGSDSGSIQGKDFSGTYRLSAVECYGSSSMTAYGVFSGSSPNETMSITGNSFDSTVTSSSCTYRSNGTMVFTEESSSGAASSGTLALTTNATTVTTGGTCTHTYTWTLSSGSGTITPSSFSSTVSTTSTPSSTNVSFLYDPSGYMLIFTSLQVSGQPSDLCFLSYQKL